MTIHDISLVLDGRTPTWPGETRFSLVQESSGAAVVSRLSLGSHTGTHVDAPRHFVPGGPGIDELPLDLFVGDAVVVWVPGPTIGVREIEAARLEGATRVLFKTTNSALLKRGGFTEGYVALEGRAAVRLLSMGVRLVGIDYLSIEAFGSEGHPVHRALLSGGVVILEGLDLSGVPEGRYTLVALPLNLAGSDGSPVRAVLLPDARDAG